MVSISKAFQFAENLHFVGWQAFFIKGLLIYSCFVGTAFSEIHESNRNSNLFTNLSDGDRELLTKECKFTGQVIKFETNNVLCITGTFKMKDIDWTQLESMKLDFIFVNSSRGGSVLAAIKLGRIIYEQSLPMFISGICLSSCANYLVPASSEIKILKNSFVGFHGTPDRNEKHYLKQFRTQSKTVIDERRTFFRRNTYAEINYFFDIGVNENYATFNYHSVRKLLAQTKCRPTNNIYFILGPKHSATYGLPLNDSWFPKSREDFNFLIASVSQQSFVYDYDDDPVYIFGQGFSNPKKCQVSIAK